MRRRVGDVLLASFMPVLLASPKARACVGLAARRIRDEQVGVCDLRDHKKGVF